jgi:ribose 5-phosphate isomerase B
LKISIGSDHGGFELKEKIRDRLERNGYGTVDRGSYDTDPVDYPDIAQLVSADIIDGKADLGILICGTGIGMMNSASRHDGVIAALCTNSYMSRMARKHNAANVLCLGGRVIGIELAWDIVTSFLKNEPRTDEKYIRRREKVNSIWKGSR